jgi:uncharacterized cupin superfamily protein
MLSRSKTKPLLSFCKPRADTLPAFPIKGGDIIARPAGGKRTAHQIINTSEEELRFLAVSTKLSPEIAEYPDTNRFGVLESLAPDET